MRICRMLVNSSIAALALVVAGCNHTVQTTSGADYLATTPQLQMSDGAFEERLRATANVEPLLRFPARIGVARIGHNHCRPTLLSPSAGEGKAWLELADRLGPGYGQFVPISPLVVAMVAPTPPACWDSDTARDVVGTVRLAAARQHIDVVMIYEVDATADTRRNPLSIANWTVIGAFVMPSRNVKAQGVAQAMLIDVRNGYPYGTIQATADDKTSATLFAGHEAERDLMNEVKTAAVVKLTREAQKLMSELREELVLRD